jgi:ABC-type transporter Mla subunit MlaD
VDKARDCASLVRQVAGINLSPRAAAAEVEREAAELERAVEGLGSEDVRQAGRSLAERVRGLQRAISQADPAEVRRALGEVRQAAEQLARTCNVPVDQLVR